MESVLEVARKLNKEFKDDKLAIKADITPNYERMSTGAFGFDYPLYGGLPLGLSKEDFYLGRQKVINESLMKVLSQLGYAETTGYGVPLIVRRYGKEAFDFSESFLQVTIPFAWKINAENAV